jgi:hypothetical protein
MAKQSFVTGQVLTAAQLTSLQQTAMSGGAASAKTANYVLVAADAGTAISMTSTSATTITVNTGLFAAGDTVFIQNLGSATCTITAGTATVDTAGSLILPQYDAGILYFVSSSSAVFYDYIQAGAVSPLTTKGDLYGFGSSDARIPIGTNGHILTADSAQTLGLKWAAPAGGGKVLQVLSTTKTDSFTSSSTSFTDVTGLSIAITPSSATSKILVLYNVSGSQDVGNQIAYSRLMRDSTEINIGDTAGSRTRGTSDPFSVADVIVGTTVAGSFLDNPASTSSLTYKFQVRTSGLNVYINRSDSDSDAATCSRTVSTITVMEIGA